MEVIVPNILIINLKKKRIQRSDSSQYFTYKLKKMHLENHWNMHNKMYLPGVTKLEKRSDTSTGNSW